ncbi:MAG: ABC transporter ATP-binding protein, partial [Fibrobacteria bacterium]|nr:ABC transporter ATP-binding protein [Fibrobacteria bacterium]
MPESVLQLKNLSCGYQDIVILNGISLNCIKGDLIGIIGPNGSGKTTLLKVISRILKPQGGELLIEGEDLQQISIQTIAQKIAVVTQFIDPVSIPVSDYIAMGRMPYFNKLQFFMNKRDQEIVDRYTTLTGSDRFHNKLMSEISGGERQLAQVARALAQEPVLMLLDEPTSHLDITHQIKILDLIRRLNKNLKLTVIMVMHDLNLASEYCNRLVLLNQGGIYKEGTPHEVLTFEHLEDVYQTPVIVEKNPLSGKPIALLVTEEEL